MRVSVIICTWNRAEALNRTLSAFPRLRIPHDTTWELLVVNNNSTDSTDQVIAEHTRYLPIRRIFEATPGKSHAANAAVRQASGDLLLWTDDDVLIDSGWLSEYVAAAHAWSQAAYFGGTVDPHFDGAVPAWIEKNIDVLYEPYALAQHGNSTFQIESQHIVGANMALRSDIARRYPFNTQLGPTGEKPLRGEDTELIGRIRTDGLEGVWVGGARIQHVIGNERLNPRYLWHWYTGLGAYTHERNRHATAVPLVMGAPRWAVRQYVGLRLKTSCLSFRKDARWLRSLRDAALMLGYIQASRRQIMAKGRD